MSVETLNGCVVIPHAPDWQRPIRWRRRWQSQLAATLQGAEDRAALRPTPLHGLEFEHRDLAQPERSMLDARLLAALKAGRAVVPLWTRPQYLASDANRCRAYLASSPWTWQEGDYAAFIAPGYPLHNVALRYNCGGLGAVAIQPDFPWWGDRDYTGGSVITTAQNILTGSVWDPPPAAVLQCGREALVTANTRFNQPYPAIVYAFGGLSPRQPARVRVHVVNWPLTGYPRALTISLVGATRSDYVYSDIPSLVSNQDWYLATLDYLVQPDASGRIILTISTNQSTWDGTTLRRRAWVNAVECLQMAWELRPVDTVVADGIIWCDGLLGHYPAGTPIYPTLWGKPTCGDMEALTDGYGQIKLKIDEPLPQVELGVPGWTGPELVPVWYQTGGGATQAPSSAYASPLLARAGTAPTQAPSVGYLAKTAVTRIITGNYYMASITDGVHVDDLWTTANTPEEIYPQTLRTNWEAALMAEFHAWCEAKRYDIVSEQIQWHNDSERATFDFFEATSYFDDGTKWWRSVYGEIIYPYVNYTVTPRD
jgi:hypothetical protein